MLRSRICRGNGRRRAPVRQVSRSALRQSPLVRGGLFAVLELQAGRMTLRSSPPRRCSRSRFRQVVQPPCFRVRLRFQLPLCPSRLRRLPARRGPQRRCRLKRELREKPLQLPCGWRPRCRLLRKRPPVRILRLLQPGCLPPVRAVQCSRPSPAQGRPCPWRHRSCANRQRAGTPLCARSWPTRL